MKNQLHRHGSLHSSITFFTALLLTLSLYQCTPPKETSTESTSGINTAHLDALYEDQVVNGDSVGIIHLYSEYPDYGHVGDDDEGIACVDDASRAAIFYLKQHKVSGDAEQLRKGRMLVKFLLAMQAPNGYYYNFIWPDGQIHMDGMTTKPEPNFWSWRTLWAFGEAIPLLDSGDPLVQEMRQQRDGLTKNILAEASYWSMETDTTMGWTFPTWLPKESGTDQAALIMIGFSLMLQQDSAETNIKKDSVVTFIENMAEGIFTMQNEQPSTVYDGVIMSWENLWHAYASIQSYALLLAGEVLEDPHMTSHAMYEIDHFYPALLPAGGLDHFSFRVVDKKVEVYDQASFPQIAYGRRPMVWAALKAYETTKDEKYLTTARDLASWFSGNNPAKAVMYDPATGRGYDGINSAEAINKNAGAESTVEALLALQALEAYK